MVSNSILKRNARDQLGNNVFSSSWLMFALVMFLYSAALSVGVELTFGLVTLVVAGPLLYGVMRISIKLACGSRQVNIEDLFIGFKECFTESLVLYLMTTIYTFLWSLLFVVPGIVKSYSYSMATYILQDNPQKGWKRSLEESKNMMEGYKMQLFMLDLSFIGWYIVGLMALGVGMFLVTPYHYMARTNFYLALKAKREVNVDYTYTGNNSGNDMNFSSGNGFSGNADFASDFKVDETNFSDFKVDETNFNDFKVDEYKADETNFNDIKTDEYKVEEKKSDETSKSDAKSGIKRKINLDK